MNTSIGSAGPHELEVIGPQHLAEGANDLTLNGPRILLHLPTRIARTFVLDRKTEA